MIKKGFVFITDHACLLYLDPLSGQETEEEQNLS